MSYKEIVEITETIRKIKECDYCGKEVQETFGYALIPKSNGLVSDSYHFHHTCVLSMLSKHSKKGKK